MSYDKKVCLLLEEGGYRSKDRKEQEMKIKGLGILAVLLTVTLASAQDATVLKDQKDKVNYGVGVNIGYNLKNFPVALDLDLLIKGIKDSISGAKLLMTEEEIREVMMGVQKEVAAKHETRMKELGEKNKKEGDAFLTENKKKEGVVSLPSGLQYKILTAGTGKTPTDTDTVTVHYSGTLLDGTVFDSSYRRGEPATFPINGIIPGWIEALKLMKEGAKWQLVIPPGLAYGERGAGAVIGPNATLLFDVELISIK
jgi:FKBP-type peptidyl-prolyl cis-trans isomerase FklB